MTLCHNIHARVLERIVMGGSVMSGKHKIPQCVDLAVNVPLTPALSPSGGEGARRAGEGHPCRIESTSQMKGSSHD